MTETLDALLTEIRACRICLSSERPLPHEPRPVLQISPRSRIMVCGQAPGTRVHASGRPFTDPSGDRLREWLGMDEATFYDADKLAILPMGFCFPGLDAKGGDLPPRKECAPAWRERVLAHAANVRLILLIGQYAQKWHLGEAVKKNLGETVEAWRDYGERMMPLPHPSWRNNAWIKKRPWFEAELIPELRKRVARALAD